MEYLKISGFKECSKIAVSVRRADFKTIVVCRFEIADFILIIIRILKDDNLGSQQNPGPVRSQVGTFTFSLWLSWTLYRV